MGQITIRWSGGEKTFPDSRTVRVGRSTDCDILFIDPRVSRNPHLEIGFTGGTWVLHDHSSSGTFASGERVDRVTLPGTHAFNLGAADGPELHVTVHAPGADVPADAAPVGAAQVPVPVPDAGPDPDPTAVAEVPAPGLSSPPGPPPAPPGVPSHTVALDDRALRLAHGDRQLVVPPGHTVTIGRDDACDLTVDSGIVSRRHLQITHDGSHWFVHDLGSTRGTFVDGRRLSAPYRAEGVFEVMLGDDDAGESVKVVTAGEHRSPRNRAPLMLAAAALVLALLVGGAVIAMNAEDDPPPATVQIAGDGIEGGEDSAPNTDAQLSEIKLSVVLIEAVDRRNNTLWTGSGTIIDDDGDILTNAHVADPQADSLRALEPLLSNLDDGTVPAGFIIWVSPDEDEPVEPRYSAELVASDPVHDASIIRITGSLDGGRARDLPAPVPLGSSDELRAGQSIDSLGYPENSTTFSISVVRGQVISFVAPDEFEGLLGGDERRVMNTNAVLGSGSSGGPVVRHGEIVGLNFTQSSVDNLDRGWVVPVSEIDDLLTRVGL